MGDEIIELVWPGDIGEHMSIERIAEKLGVNFYDLQPLIIAREVWLTKKRRKEGRREVVKWLEDNKFSLVAMDNYCDFGIDDTKLQAKLKDWGLEAGDE